METYPVDIDPEQVVRWVRAECEAASSSFRIRGTRSREARELPAGKDVHLGDEEREDLSEIATIATLELAPLHTGDGWLLRIVLEDELGPRLAEGGLGDSIEQPIDLGTFYKEFIRPGRGTASVVVEVEDDAAKARINRLISAIETNQHGANRDALGT